MSRMIGAALVLSFLVGCGGHAEFARRGDGQGELMLKGRQESAYEDAQQQIREACGGRQWTENRNTISNGRGMVGRGGSGMIHYECAAN